MFGQSIVGSCYGIKRCFNTFRVLQIKPYPKRDVSKQYKEILKFPAGVLVAVAHRGTLIPNITLTGGVVRLLQVEVEGEVYDTPKAICEALCVKLPMYAYDIYKFDA